MGLNEYVPENVIESDTSYCIHPPTDTHTHVRARIHTFMNAIIINNIYNTYRKTPAEWMITSRRLVFESHCGKNYVALRRSSFSRKKIVNQRLLLLPSNFVYPVYYFTIHGVFCCETPYEIGRFSFFRPQDVTVTVFSSEMHLSLEF